jgi:hypothetical protein
LTQITLSVQDAGWRLLLCGTIPREDCVSTDVSSGEGGIRTVSVWREGQAPLEASLSHLGDIEGVPWIDLVSNGDAATLLPKLQGACPGLTLKMLEDLLTPDDGPEGVTYGEGEIKLASTFSVRAKRLERKRERGKAIGAGVLVFQPVELLACDEWLLTCWHRTRTFCGAEVVADGEPGSAADILSEVVLEWLSLERGGGGDLGVLAMARLALGYRAAGWKLSGWLQDWELGLYVEDALDNPEELPNLWGMMAVLRDWLNPLNRPGLRTMPDRAWLPNCDHETVVEIDERVDKALAQLHTLANAMRASFSVLHVQTAEAARERKERSQHRVELAAAIFLVPTLIVGFYGANTWVPGQGRHWGCWVMTIVLLAGTAIAVGMVLRMRREERQEERRIRAARESSRRELLQALD